MDLSTLIEKKITEGKKILSDLSLMRETSGIAINVTYYAAEDVEEAIRKINKWQLTVNDILINGYGTSHRYVSTFESTITKKDSGFNFRKEFEHEMNQGLSVLESISESLALGLDGECKSLDAEKTGPKPPLVFISHAELDKEFANEIVTLFEFIGVKGKEKLLCTSVDGYRIPVGRDIVEYLREVFNKYNLFVIILHTHNYYTRPVCLNEMGAAWALKTKYYSVLASDFNFKEMTGVVNNKDVAIKIGAEDCETRLNQLKNALVDFFGLPQPDEDRWPHYRGKFIKNSSKFKSLKSEANKEKAPKGMPLCDDSLVALSTSFRVFEEDEGLYPFQIDVKFTAQKKDVYIKAVKLSNSKRTVELDGFGAEDDILNLRKYLKLNTLNIEKKKEYRNSVDELYNTSSIYVEDHRIDNSALETMSFHGAIGLKRHMDGYDEFDTEGWQLYVTYNVIGELTIPLQVRII